LPPSRDSQVAHISAVHSRESGGDKLKCDLPIPQTSICRIA
jgi:hypothetical protein